MSRLVSRSILSLAIVTAGVCGGSPEAQAQPPGAGLAAQVAALQAAVASLAGQVTNLQTAVTALQASAGTPVTCQAITQPGRYILNQNLTASGDCLVIQGNFVTLDLNGFSITGNGTGSGITDQGAARKGVVIRNGTITHFDTGIDLTASSGSTIEHVRLVDNGVVLGGDSRVTGNWVLNAGILFNGGLVTGNVVTESPGRGIEGSNGVISGNNVTFSGEQGIIVEGGGTLIRDNAVNLSQGGSGVGILAETGNAIINNVVVGNHADGIASSPQNTISGNTASTNGGHGISVICESNLVGNTARGNTGTNLSTSGSGCTTFDNLF